MHNESCETDSKINEWHRWCRLCAKYDDNNLDIFNGQAGKPLIPNTNIASALNNFFNIHINQNATDLPVLLCSECCNTVTSLGNYAEHVKKVQQMYEALQNTNDYAKIDLKGLYHKYGIVKCEVFITQILPGLDTSTTRATPSAIEEIFVDAVVPDVNIKCEDTEETEARSSDCKPKVKVENPVPFVQSDQDIAECTQMSEDSDNSSSNNIPSNNEEYDKETMPLDNKDSDFTDSLATDKCSKDGNYTCYICQQRFIQNRNYVSHMKNKHTIDVPLYNCEQCSSGSFRRKKDLDRHIKKVHEPSVYPCPHCDRKFKGKKVAENHIKIEHEGARTFICEECGESVRTKERLLEHMAIHTGGAFECKECGKRFARKNYLKKHLEIHGDKHICGECGAELTTSKALKYHMKVHSDEMPYKCNYCGRRFKRTKNLKNHLITHTGLKPYSCDFCDKTFSTGSSCRYHKKHLHPKELAAMEAAGVKSYTKNIPKIDVLKAITQAAGGVEKISECVSDKRIKLPKLDSELPDS